MNGRRSRKPAVVLAALLVGAAVFTTTADAQKSAPVAVTNTTANPVPVTGSVSVTNSPTVRIDQQTNTVRVAATMTKTLLFQYFEFTGGFSQAIYDLDVAPYEKVRVCFTNRGFLETRSAVAVSIYNGRMLENGVVGFEFTLDSFLLPEAPRYSPYTTCKMFEVAGTALSIAAQSDGKTSILVGVYAR